MALITQSFARIVNELPGESPAETFWERIATTRWGRYTTETARETILKAHSLCGRPTIAIELGCEGGRWARLLSSLGWSMVCTDIDEESLKTCKARVPVATCVLVSPNDTSIPIASSSADLLLCIEVAPVVQSSWLIAESHRVLRPGGVLAATFWNRWSLRGLYADWASRLRRRPSWYSYPYGPWKARLLDQGFEMLHEHGYCWFPFSRESNSALVPLATAMERRLHLERLSAVSPWIALIARKTR